MWDRVGWWWWRVVFDGGGVAHVHVLCRPFCGLCRSAPSWCRRLAKKARRAAQAAARAAGAPAPAPSAAAVLALDEARRGNGGSGGRRGKHQPWLCLWPPCRERGKTFRRDVDLANHLTSVHDSRHFPPRVSAPHVLAGVFPDHLVDLAAGAGADGSASGVARSLPDCVRSALLAEVVCDLGIVLSADMGEARVDTALKRVRTISHNVRLRRLSRSSNPSYAQHI